MSDIGEDLKAHAGGMPLWVWGLVLAGGGYIIVRFFADKSSTAGTALPQIGAAPPAAEGSSSDGGTAPQAQTFYDNQSWENAVIADASALGFSPIQVQQALTDYLNGSDLSPEEGSIVNRAIGLFGAAPLGTSGVSQIVTPPTTPPASATTPPSTTTPPAATTTSTPIESGVTPQAQEASGVPAYNVFDISPTLFSQSDLPTWLQNIKTSMDNGTASAGDISRYNYFTGAAISPSLLKGEKTYTPAQVANINKEAAAASAKAKSKAK